MPKLRLRRRARPSTAGGNDTYAALVFFKPPYVQDAYSQVEIGLI